MAAIFFSLGLLVAVPSLASQVAEGAAPSISEPYRIGPEDLLDISVWKEEELQREVLVRPDGGISFPLAGDIQVAGKTVKQVQDELAKRIRKYIPGAVVTVATKTIAGYRVYVMGKVNNPGQYSVGRYVDVMQALTLAGGMTPFADENKVKVIRRVDGGEEVYGFDYSKVRAGKSLEQNILLRSGDVVVVP
ncbi:polysaccharide biosynthesis/export family protein [Alkalilimnicola sp. S0819]|uniref:polysaccharide biosynthesis/export family protein n=1 Tax=Alkalilimnicola sp. S0819 TaxID=2613922 RepID=UPI001D00DA3A|nr:polysaccharide biosynthesis/export family protein [Alkalilimnicola sp. S0819]